MKRFISLAIILLSSQAFADVPNTFTNGTAADATDVNENFTDLDDRVQLLEKGDFSYNEWVSYDYIETEKGDIVNIPEIEYSFVWEAPTITQYPNETHESQEEFEEYWVTWQEEHTVVSDEYIIQELRFYSSDETTLYKVRAPVQAFGYYGYIAPDTLETSYLDGEFYTPSESSLQIINEGLFNIKIIRLFGFETVDTRTLLNEQYSTRIEFYGQEISLGNSCYACTKKQIDALVDHFYFKATDI